MAATKTLQSPCLTIFELFEKWLLRWCCEEALPFWQPASNLGFWRLGNSLMCKETFKGWVQKNYETCATCEPTSGPFSLEWFGICTFKVFKMCMLQLQCTGICTSTIDYFNAISHASQFEVGKGITALPCCDTLCRGTFLVFQLAPTLRVAKVTLEAAPTVGLGGAEKTEGLVHQRHKNCLGMKKFIEEIST